MSAPGTGEPSEERNVVCEHCGDLIETEPIPAGEDGADQIIDGYEHGCVEDEDDGGDDDRPE